jgi:hypothetical protein
MRTDTHPHQQEKEKRNTGTPAGQGEEGQVQQQAKEIGRVIRMGHVHQAIKIKRHRHTSRLTTRITQSHQQANDKNNTITPAG